MFLEWILELSSSLVTLIVSGVLIPFIVNFLKSKTDNEKLQSVIRDLGCTVATSVDFITRTIVNIAKEEGTWNAEKKRYALQCAIDEVMRGLSHQTKQIIKNDKLDLQGLILRRIEAELEARKRNATYYAESSEY